MYKKKKKKLKLSNTYGSYFYSATDYSLSYIVHNTTKKKKKNFLS